MQLVNASYAVLSDPVRRRKHDGWIKSKEAASASQANQQGTSQQEHQRGYQPNRTHAHYAANHQEKQGGSPKPPGAGTKDQTRLRYRSLALKGVAVVGVAGILIYLNSLPAEPSGLPPYDQNAESAKASNGDEVLADVFGPQAESTNTSPNVAPTQTSGPIAEAPNGNPWPQSAGYVPGYPRLRTAGHSSVTIDNSSNSADVFVKLVKISSDKTQPIRQIYIPKYGTFEVGSVSPGTYDVRYMDLGDGSLARSESFVLKETEEDSGISFNNITMTLYKVANGNMKTYPLSPTEF